jgi:Putative zinc-finger
MKSGRDYRTEASVPESGYGHPMEHAPLRPVPARPAGPIDPAAAASTVDAALPALSRLDVQALALVALAELPRAEAATALGIDPDALAIALARARKELRRTLVPLGGSGWCERAERSISDRLDGALADAATRGLDIHLRNCPRCVEHERRLVQATDALLASAAAGSPGAMPPAPGAFPPEGIPGQPPARIPGQPAPVPDVPPPTAPVVTLPAAGSAERAYGRAPKRVSSIAVWSSLFAVAWLSVLVVVILGALGVL